MRWILVAVFLLLAGLALGLGLLVFAMYALLGVIILSRLLAQQWTDGISALRRCSLNEGNIGEAFHVNVIVKNSGRWSVPWLLLEDSIPKAALLQRPPRLRVKRKRRSINRVPAGGQTTLAYQVTPQMRGYYQIGPLLVESGDLFGLHRRYRVLTEPHFVLVYPRVLPVPNYDLASRRPIGEIRLVHRLFEDPTRISGVRPYQVGDPLNRIHWRATARTGELHSKTYEPSSIAGATFLLDFHGGRYASRHEPLRSELAVTTVASLSNAVYQMGQQVGFFTNGRDAADRVRIEGYRHEFTTRQDAQQQLSEMPDSDRLRPVAVETRRGPDQLMRILQTLARVELTDGLSFPQLVPEVHDRLPRDATVVAVLPDVPAETAIALGSLKRRGYAVTAIVVMYEDEDHYPDCMGRLIAQNIDTRRISDEAMLSTLCGRQTVGLV